MEWLREHPVVMTFLVLDVLLGLLALISLAVPALKEKIFQSVFSFFVVILAVLTANVILQAVVPAAFQTAHPDVMGMMSIGSGMLFLFLLSLPFPVVKEEILKPFLANISIVLVAITYFTVFAVTALLMKLFGRRLLPDPRKLRNAPSYWTEREKTQPTMEYLKRQF